MSDVLYPVSCELHVAKWQISRVAQLHLRSGKADQAVFTVRTLLGRTGGASRTAPTGMHHFALGHEWADGQTGQEAFAAGQGGAGMGMAFRRD